MMTGIAMMIVSYLFMILITYWSMFSNENWWRLINHGYFGTFLWEELIIVLYLAGMYASGTRIKNKKILIVTAIFFIPVFFMCNIYYNVQEPNTVVYSKVVINIIAFVGCVVLIDRKRADILKWLLDANRSTIVIALLVIVSLATVVWTYRYPALYYYYTWRSEHSVESKEQMALSDEIVSISPHIIPLLVQKYEDVNTPRGERFDAVLGLIEADKKTAVSLFTRNLGSNNPDILSDAISDLASVEASDSLKKFDEKLRTVPLDKVVKDLFSAKSNQSFTNNTDVYNLIIKLANHPNAKVRREVASYLGSNKNAESLSILKHMKENDPDADVRIEARKSLSMQ
jgi:hypothetical protein